MKAVDFRKRLAMLDTNVVSDAIDHFGFSGVAIAIYPQIIEGRVCGRVVTVKLKAITRGEVAQ